jgi:hypothetical protein
MYIFEHFKKITNPVLTILNATNATKIFTCSADDPLFEYSSTFKDVHTALND